MDIIFVNNVFYKCLSSILPTIHSTRSQICNYLPRIILQQRNPHVRTKFINPIHENHTKHPLKLQFKCDYFFFPPLKINRTQKTQLTSCAFCCHGRGTSGGGWGGHRLPCLCVPNGTAAGAVHCHPARGWGCHWGWPRERCGDLCAPWGHQIIKVGKEH